MVKSLVLAAAVFALLLVSCASAGDVILDDVFLDVGGSKVSEYSPVVGQHVTHVAYGRPGGICFKDVEKFADTAYILVTWDSMEVCEVYEGTSCKDDLLYDYSWDRGLKNGATVVANVTVGYQRDGVTGEWIFYCYFKDQNGWDTLSGDEYLAFSSTLTCPGNCVNYKFNDLPHTPNINYHWYDDIESGECIITTADPSAIVGMLAKGDLGDGYDATYDIVQTIAIYQYYEIEELIPGYCYNISLVKNTYYPWSSKIVVYNDNYLFINQTVFDLENSSHVVIGDSAVDMCTNGIIFDCYLYSDMAPMQNVHAGGFCGDAEPGYFDLSGYTRSVYGNLISEVLLTTQGETEYSSNTSFYKFENLETGSFTLVANKTGYWNTTDSMYVGVAEDRQHDVYMIPLDALDEGEFGGVVYDYCTLKPILGAYVYLFNETADSGSYAYSNKYGFYRFAGMTEDIGYKISASKDGYDASIVHSFTFNESNVNETHYKTKNIWLLPEGGCPEDGGIPTPPPAPTPTPHEWTNEEIVSWLRVNLMGMFIIVLIFTFLWFIRRAGGSRR